MKKEKKSNPDEPPLVFRPTSEAVESFWSGVFRRYAEAELKPMRNGLVGNTVKPKRQVVR